MRACKPATPQDKVRAVHAASYRSGGVSLSPVYRKAQRQAQQQQRQEQMAAKKYGSDAPGPIISASGPASTSYDILEAFFYGRAFAITLSKRLGAVVVDAVAEISKAAAERPQRVQEFQEEVAQLVRKEMMDASVPVRPSAITPASSSASTSSNSSAASSSSSSTPSQPQDLEALVDDLRAEIATTRSVLQLIKTNGKSGAPPGLPTPAGGEKEKDTSKL